MLAAAEAAQEASTAALCGRGVKLAVASAADLASSVPRSLPSSHESRKIRRTATALAKIEEVRVGNRRRRTRSRPAPFAAPRSRASLLDGTYVTVTTAADARRARIPAGDPLYKRLPIRQRLVLRGGVYKLYWRERPGTSDVHAGTYTLYRDRIVLIDPPGPAPVRVVVQRQDVDVRRRGEGRLLRRLLDSALDEGRLRLGARQLSDDARPRPGGLVTLSSAAERLETIGKPLKAGPGRGRRAPDAVIGRPRLSATRPQSISARSCAGRARASRRSPALPSRRSRPPPPRPGWQWLSPKRPRTWRRPAL